jgi:hypothetical protein
MWEHLLGAVGTLTYARRCRSGAILRIESMAAIDRVMRAYLTTRDLTEAQVATVSRAIAIHRRTEAARRPNKPKSE